MTSHQSRNRQMRAVPIFPGRGVHLESSLAGGDALQIDLSHAQPVLRLHGTNPRLISHIRLDRYIRVCYHPLTFAKAHMILRRIEMESNMEKGATTVNALKAHLALNVSD